MADLVPSCYLAQKGASIIMSEGITGVKMLEMLTGGSFQFSPLSENVWEGVEALLKITACYLDEKNRRCYPVVGRNQNTKPTAFSERN